MKIKLFTILLLVGQTFNLVATTSFTYQFDVFSSYKYDSSYLKLKPITDLKFEPKRILSRIIYSHCRCCIKEQLYNPFVPLKMVNSYLYHDSSIAKKKDKVSYNITVDQSFTGITITVKRQGGPNIVPYVIQNNMGRDLAQGELSYAGSEVETSINISSMSKGSYSITVGEGSESTTTFFQVK